MKKVLSLILALTLCMALAAPAMAAEQQVDEYTYVFSNEILGTEAVVWSEPMYDENGHFIRDESGSAARADVPHTVYVVPAGTVVTNSEGLNMVRGAYYVRQSDKSLANLFVSYNIFQSVTLDMMAWYDDEGFNAGKAEIEEWKTLRRDMMAEENISASDIIYKLATVPSQRKIGGSSTLEDENSIIYLKTADAPAPTQPAQSAPLAYASTQNVDLDGKAVEFQCYALKDENGNATTTSSCATSRCS